MTNKKISKRLIKMLKKILIDAKEVALYEDSTAETYKLLSIFVPMVEDIIVNNNTFKNTDYEKNKELIKKEKDEKTRVQKEIDLMILHFDSYVEKL